ncbi:MAG: hypothetical protein H6585_07870 [Flavobacteriales bacterium]|nr:hypothetical protein [Flavobacteriales bacterium]
MEASVYLHYINYGLYSYVDINFEKAKYHLDQATQLLEQSNVGLLQSQALLYIKILYHHGVVNSLFGKKKAVEAAIQRLGALSIRSENLQIAQSCRLNILRTLMWSSTSDAARVEQESGEFLDYLNVNRDRIPISQQALLYRNICLGLFMHRYIKQATAVLHYYMNEKSLHSRYDSYALMKFISLFLYFESGAYELLKSSLASAEYVFRKKKEIFPIETITLDFFKTLIKREDFPRLPKDLLLEYSNNLEKVSTQSDRDTMMLNASFVRRWVDSVKDSLA